MKVVAYARVSSKDQSDMDLSIPAQLKAIRKHCQDKGWSLVGEYIDEADRPFQRMVALAKKLTATSMPSSSTSLIGSVGAMKNVMRSGSLCEMLYEN